MPEERYSKRITDTIIAISTPPGPGGLGIVRLSGQDAMTVARRIFRPRTLKSIPPRKAVLGHLYDRQRGENLDEAFCLFFPGPFSYTRENMVELSCHGSPAVLEEAVSLGIREGARLALPGEFTLRAYLKGRLDILQAEAVNSLIHSTSLVKAKISFRQVEGNLSQRMNVLRLKFIEILAEIEAGIEFPDEEPGVFRAEIEQDVKEAILKAEKLLQSYETGKKISEGVELAIAGRRNVGKSTLFNALLERERAIVTPYPGTTRDYISESVRIRGVTIKLTDMAGVGNPSHAVEKEGIRRSKEKALQADGVLLLLDASRKENQQDLALIKSLRRKRILILLNKIDLPRRLDRKKIRAVAGKAPLIEISALKGTNLEQLKEWMAKFLPPEGEKGEEIILHLRQKILLEQVVTVLKRTLSLLESRYSEEVAAEEMRKAISFLGELTGEVSSDDVLEKIFGTFCIGK